MGFLKKLFGRKTDPAPVPVRRFYLVDGMAMLYSVRDGAPATNDDLEYMMAKIQLSSRQFDLLADFPNGLFMHRSAGWSLEQMEQALAFFQLDHSDRNETVMLGTGIHFAARLQRTPERMQGNVVSLSGGEKVEVVPLWAGPLADGAEGWLVTFATV